MKHLKWTQRLSSADTTVQHHSWGQTSGQPDIRGLLWSGLPVTRTHIYCSSLVILSFHICIVSHPTLFDNSLFLPAVVKKKGSIFGIHGSFSFHGWWWLLNQRASKLHPQTTMAWCVPCSFRTLEMYKRWRIISCQPPSFPWSKGQQREREREAETEQEKDREKARGKRRRVGSMRSCLHLIESACVCFAAGVCVAATLCRLE